MPGGVKWGGRQKGILPPCPDWARRWVPVLGLAVLSRQGSTLLEFALLKAAATK